MCYLGFVNVYKEPGYTSHDVVAILRKLTGGKAGHTGTLDPNAQGVLPVCLGRATKLADYIMAEDKTYIAEVVLGITTDTGDTTGKIVSQSDATPTAVEIKNAVAGFTGEQWQRPPMYSAVKIDGKKLYELARKGKTVERTPRRIVIHAIHIINPQEEADSSLKNNRRRFFIEVSCSKGTYIRVLCEDIGKKLGCGAAMGALTRTQSGMFEIKNALRLDALKTAAQDGQLGAHILPPAAALPYPKAVVHDDALPLALNGNPLPLALVTHDAPISKVWLHSSANQLIGLFTHTPDGKLRAEVML